MKKLLFVFLAGITSYSHAQQTNTLQQKPDSVFVLKQESLNSKRLVPYLVPATFIFYGVLAQEKRVLRGIDRNVSLGFQENYADLRTHLDDGLQYLPAISVYALGSMGVKGKNRLADKSAIYFISNAVMCLTVRMVKSKTHKLRPDGSDHLSFPSGHTATAFVAAEFLNQEYSDVSPWYSVAGYTIATATGTLRMVNNRHWLSDVVMGAGVGILSTKLAYAVYPAIKSSVLPKESSKLMVLPAYQQGAYGLSMTVQLN